MADRPMSDNENSGREVAVCNHSWPGKRVGDVCRHCFRAHQEAAPTPPAPGNGGADALVTAMVEAHPAFAEWWNELPETTAQSFMVRMTRALAEAPVSAPVDAGAVDQSGAWESWNSARIGLDEVIAYGGDSRVIRRVATARNWIAAHEPHPAASAGQGQVEALQVAAVRKLCEEWNAEARAEGFGGGNTRAKMILAAMDEAALPAASLSMGESSHD